MTDVEFNSRARTYVREEILQRTPCLGIIFHTLPQDACWDRKAQESTLQQRACMYVTSLTIYK